MGSMVKSFTQVGSLRGSEEERNVNRKMVKELCGDLVSMRYFHCFFILIFRVDRKSQVTQCLVFCPADS